MNTAYALVALLVFIFDNAAYVIVFVLAAFAYPASVYPLTADGSVALSLVPVFESDSTVV